MPHSTTAAPAFVDDGSEDLLGLWSDLEAGLSMVLAQPFAVQEFPRKVVQYDRWMRWLLEQDADTALYMLFQLASTSSAGYSASHALVCAALCHVVAGELRLPPDERDALVRAAMTMNIAMTDLQDRLTMQDERPAAAQRQSIERHAEEGASLLQRLGVADGTWVEVVRTHHAAAPRRGTDWAALPSPTRLALVLATVDRYAAMISPRVTRSGRSASDSVRALVQGRGDQHPEIADALHKVVGAWPPGTFVTLDSGETAVVVRREGDVRMPVVAIVVDADGKALRLPRLHRTAAGSPRIRTQVARGQIGTPLNNLRLLQVGVHARRHLGDSDSAAPPSD